jgi:hypothetical protein
MIRHLLICACALSTLCTSNPLSVYDTQSEVAKNDKIKKHKVEMSDTVAITTMSDPVVPITTFETKNTDGTNGYRYYKFVANESNLGGPYEAILTETSFIDTVATNYALVSHDPVLTGTINALFDGDLTVGPQDGQYVKYNNSAPWHWTADVNSPRKFKELKISSLDIFFYKEPSHITISGSNDLTNWAVVADTTFNTAYNNAAIQLTY